MKKIVAAFDGLAFSQSTLTYALELAAQTKSHLVGVFLDDFSRLSFSMREVVQYEGVFNDRFQELRLRDQAERNVSVQKFEKECQDRGVMHSIHRDRNVALQELLHESVYADLLIVEAKQSFSRLEGH